MLHAERLFFIQEGKIKRFAAERKHIIDIKLVRFCFASIVSKYQTHRPSRKIKQHASILADTTSEDMIERKLHGDIIAFEQKQPMVIKQQLIQRMIDNSGLAKPSSSKFG